jgi:RNA polymerase sigma-70 factor (ECF subfamily)
LGPILAPALPRRDQTWLAGRPYLSIVMRSPLGSGRMESAKAAAPQREFLRPVLVSDAALEEQRLIESIRAGNAAAFGQLVERYLPRALALANRILHHREDAEDLVQDAFLAALKHIDDFDPARPFWPWMSRIIVNRGLDLSAARSIRSTEILGDHLADRGSSPAMDAERSDIFAQVRQAMLALPPRRRLVIELFELEGYSITEIARVLESAPSTIRWHLHVARHQLRAALAHVRGASA